MPHYEVMSIIKTVNLLCFNMPSQTLVLDTFTRVEGLLEVRTKTAAKYSPLVITKSGIIVNP